MNKTFQLGRYLFAISMMAFGLMHFMFSNFVTGLLPVPTWIPGRLSLAYFTSVVLLAAGTGIVANKWAQQSAILLGFMWFLCVLLLHIPKLAAMVPSWIPGRLFWAYLTGVAHIAAGLSILTTIKARRLAATLLASMIGLWVLILHIPKVVVSPGNLKEWSGAFIALAICGGALLIAGSLRKKASWSGLIEVLNQLFCAGEITVRLTTKA